MPISIILLETLESSSARVYATDSNSYLVVSEVSAYFDLKFSAFSIAYSCSSLVFSVSAYFSASKVAASCSYLILSDSASYLANYAMASFSSLILSSSS